MQANLRAMGARENQQAVFIDFENIALWADRELFDFALTPLIEHLQARGPALVKRAYGDWGRFLRYREELMNLSIDLIQIYAVRPGKNRADIRMAIDAVEIAMTRPQINTFVIVSGDSDFSPLVARLREYGRYTVGIGPRSISHELLVRSCDEFIYLETLFGETGDVGGTYSNEREQARSTLLKGLQAHGQRGEVPVLAAKLKQTMLLMDPAFNEVNFGYSQFKSWLEDNMDLIKLFVKDLQLFVAPVNYVLAGDLGLLPVDVLPEQEEEFDRSQSLEIQYRQLFTRLRLNTADYWTRRDVLRDIYRELNDRPNELNSEELLDNLRERYESQNLNRSKPVLRDIFQMALRQDAFRFGQERVSPEALLRLTRVIESEADFVLRAESDIVHAVVRAGQELELSTLAHLILNDRSQIEYIQKLLDDLRKRSLITRKGKGYALAGRDAIPFCNDPALEVVCRDVLAVKVPDGMETGVAAARSLAKAAMVQRSQDFIAAASNLLVACRLQWDAVERSDTGATLQDLRWYLASYASANAGKLSQVSRDYSAARPYYLAFFALVQESDPLWTRMRGLINPMLSYYWANAGRELDINTSTWNLGGSAPAQIAVQIAMHPNMELRERWQSLTEALARVNPGLVRRIADQIDVNRSESPEQGAVAELMVKMLEN
jgi:hypothetical protein